MKKFSKLAVILLAIAVLSSMFAITACSSSVNEIAIDSGNMPQVTFVQGQDLDLSSGKLSVKTSGGVDLVPLDDANVTVSGYDKNTLGQQQLTISYKKKTTTLNVTVVKRIEVSNQTTNYFIGEDFNKTQGRLTITKDDGTSFTVSMSADTVSVSGFNSSAASTDLPITVNYVNGEMNYSGSFSVNVYDYSKDLCSFTKPKTLSYKSHDTEIDLTGAYITLKNGDGQLTRYVSLTTDMIKGFDPSQATIDNMSSPLVQTVSVEYAGLSFSFDVNITFSNISLVKQRGDELSSIDWTKGAETVITEEQGENALSAMETYSTFSDKEKAYVTDDEKAAIARAAAVYGSAKWQTAAKEYASFTFNDNGQLVWSASSASVPSYETIYADYEKLSNASEPIRTIAQILKNVKSEFADTVIYGETTASAYLANIYDADNFNEVLGQMEFMFALYQNVKNIPENWSENLSAYSTDISSALTTIKNSNYKTSTYFTLYYIVNDWSQFSNIFTVLYNYCYATNDATSVNVVKNIYLMSPFDSLYEYCMYATMQRYYMTQNVQVDTTLFMVYYDLALDVVDAIANSNSDMAKWLYSNLTFSGFSSSDMTLGTVLYYLKVSTYGYISNLGMFYGDDDYMAYWQSYLDVTTKYFNNTDNYRTSEAFGTDVAALLKTFVEMSPSEQYGFISSLNTYYTSGYPTLALAATENKTVYTYYMLFLNTYYSSVLTTDEEAIYENLLCALEYYARRYDTTDAHKDGLANFRTTMASVIEAYGKLSSTENFDKYLGDFYQKYVAIYNNYDEDGNFKSTELSEDWKAKFEELKNDIIYMNYAYYYIAYSQNYYVPFYAAYERAQKIASEIKASDDQNVLNAYYYDNYEVFSNSSYSLDYFMATFRGIYVSLLTGTSLSSSSAYSMWDYYYDRTELKSFMSDASYVMWTALTTSSSSETEAFTEPSKVIAAMKSFKELASINQLLYFSMDSSNFYYGSLARFFNEALTENAAAVANKLLTFEHAYVYYVNYADNETYSATYAAALKTAYESLKAAYDALETDDKASFDSYLSEIYQSYLQAYAELKLDSTSSESSDSNTTAVVAA